MKVSVKCMLLLGLVLGLCLPGRAAEHKVTVQPDAATKGDIDLTVTGVSGLAVGDEVSQSLRKLIMGVVGELHTLLENRIDDYGYLTLDDGLVVALLEGDTIIEAAAAEDPNHHVVVTFRCSNDPTECRFGQVVCPCKERPAGITVCTGPPNELPSCRSMGIPPRKRDQ